MITNDRVTELISLIKEGLHKTACRLVEKNNFRDASWTQACFETIRNIGCSQNFQVAPDTYNCEWLYDLVWKKYDNGYFTSLVLALESEWNYNYDAVMYDFLKLVQSTAQIKILICNLFDDDGLSQFLSAINAYECMQDNEIYLFAMYTQEKSRKGFVFKIAQRINDRGLFGFVE